MYLGFVLFTHMYLNEIFIHCDLKRECSPAIKEKITMVEKFITQTYCAGVHNSYYYQ